MAILFLLKWLLIIVAYIYPFWAMGVLLYYWLFNQEKESLRDDGDLTLYDIIELMSFMLPIIIWFAGAETSKTGTPVLPELNIWYVLYIANILTYPLFLVATFFLCMPQFKVRINKILYGILTVYLICNFIDFVNYLLK